MSRYIDADAFKRNNADLLHCDFPYLCEDTLEEIIDAMPTADVVSKEKYDELNEKYHRLLEGANILADAVREYERREDDGL